MERGLLWLPLLAMFFWLTWSGWNEYRKVEAYKVWAENFDNAKYDIYAVLGRKDRQLTWGKPTRQGMVELESFSLDDVGEISLLIADKQYDPDWDKEVATVSQADFAAELENLPRKGNPSLQFSSTEREAVRVPFTDIALAAKWHRYLLQAKGSASV